VGLEAHAGSYLNAVIVLLLNRGPQFEPALKAYQQRPYELNAQ
jgi:hypothetical protein